MALDKTIILAALKKRGLTESNADFLTFETEAQMNTFLDSLQPAPPLDTNGVTDPTIKDLLTKFGSQPVAEVEKYIRQYGDKRIGDAKKLWEKDHKPGNEQSDPKPADIAGLITSAVEAALKPVTDKVNQLENEKTKEVRTSKIKTLLNNELPVDLHELVLSTIPSDADDAKIQTIIGEHKATFTKLGIQGIGVPGGGSGTLNTTTASKEIEGWGKNKKEKEAKKIETVITKK